MARQRSGDHTQRLDALRAEGASLHDMVRSLDRYDLDADVYGELWLYCWAIAKQAERGSGYGPLAS
jgi:hypothetical protein